MPDSTSSSAVDNFMIATTQAAMRAAIGVGTASTLAATTDGTLAGNSDSNLATERAVKTYVDSLVTGLLDLKSELNCSTNPNYPAGVKGDAYPVSAAGRVGGGSGPQVDIGDMVVCKTDNAGGTHAVVGSSWFILERNVSGLLLATNNLSDIFDSAAARGNLGIDLVDNTPDSDKPVSTDQAAAILEGVAAGIAAIRKVFGITIDGNGAVPSTGVKGYWRSPAVGVIKKVTLIADQSGSAVIDIWKDSFANYPPTNADTITASAKPTLASAIKVEDSTLNGWNKNFAAGDVFGFSLTSVSTCTRLTLQIEYEAS